MGSRRIGKKFLRGVSAAQDQRRFDAFAGGVIAIPAASVWTLLAGEVVGRERRAIDGTLSAVDGPAARRRNGLATEARAGVAW